jgi:ribosomal protein S12 methylthiotransferase
VKKNSVSIVSLGCSKNLVDSERILGTFAMNGFEVSFDTGKSDYIVVNTCAFLKPARDEAEEVISEFIEKKKRGSLKKVIVAGCYPSLEGRKLLQKFPEIDALIGTNNIGDVVDALKNDASYISRSYERYMYPRIKTTLPHYEYLKIADGCNHKCTFCIIPKIKGRTHSFSKESLIKEAKALVQSGVKELLVIAQDITQYGMDLYGKPELISLLAELDKIEGVSWIRLMYAYPSLSMFDLIDFMGTYEHIVPYIDIPIQHISDKILRKMKRATRRKDIEAIFTKIKKNNVAIRTSVIVGFPYETEDDFEELKQFVSGYEIDHLGVFEYSNEEKSTSYAFDEQVKDEIKGHRFEEIVAVRDTNAEKRAKKLLGSIVPTIVDYYDDNIKKFVGRTIYDAPEIDDIVYFNGTLNPGTIFNAKIIEASPYEYVAKKVGSKST